MSFIEDLAPEMGRGFRVDCSVRFFQSARPRRNGTASAVRTRRAACRARSRAAAACAGCATLMDR